MKMAYDIPDGKVEGLANALAMIFDRLTDDDGKVIETDAELIDRYVMDHLKERHYAWLRRQHGVGQVVDHSLITVGAKP